MSENLNSHFITSKEVTCTDCGAEASGYIECEPDENMPAVLMFKSVCTTNIHHDKKRRCSGLERKLLGSELVGKSVAEFRRRQAATGKLCGKISAPDLAIIVRFVQMYI